MSGTRRRRGSATTTLALLAVVLLGCASTEEPTVLPADAQYALGLRQYEEGDHDRAVATLRAFVSQYPQDPRRVDARWLIAEAQYGSRDWATAAQEYLGFQSDYPRSERAAEALFRAGRAYEEMSLRPELDQRDTERAIRVYERIPVEYPASEFADQARERRARLRDKLAEKTFLNAEFYFDDEEYEAAEIYARDLIARYPETNWIPAGYALLARARCARGMHEQAADAYERLQELFPDAPATRAVRGQLRGACLPPTDAADRADDGTGGGR